MKALVGFIRCSLVYAAVWIAFGALTWRAWTVALLLCIAITWSDR